eukprot:gnl/TRDRNA2_/TRDRNA2_184394_c0_seq1.p1 gnl/TRDRNA2_/TRDRNA2_184394_c0~~gnl/TRDRNA2_/TRDRNA2_184394_c0_seq1.p1  ORF type:complete len:240 (+),score=33.85 gnl/TRDRNA2_/TRDRNA2_184394_c0_seq1:167-886(+)
MKLVRVFVLFGLTCCVVAGVPHVPSARLLRTSEVSVLALTLSGPAGMMRNVTHSKIAGNGYRENSPLYQKQILAEEAKKKKEKQDKEKQENTGAGSSRDKPIVHTGVLSCVWMLLILVGSCVLSGAGLFMWWKRKYVPGGRTFHHSATDGTIAIMLCGAGFAVAFGVVIYATVMTTLFSDFVSGDREHPLLCEITTMWSVVQLCINTCALGLVMWTMAGPGACAVQSTTESSGRRLGSA